MANNDDLIELEERIVSLRSDILSYGKEIVQYITALYSNNFPGKQFDLKKADNPFNVLKVLKQEVSEILLQSKLKESFFQQVIRLLRVLTVWFCYTIMILTLEWKGYTRMR